MAVFKCTAADGRFENVETDHECVDDLYRDLLEHRCVNGRILKTRRTDERGLLEVYGARSIIFTKSTYERIEDCTVRFVRYEPDAAE